MSKWPEARKSSTNDESKSFNNPFADGWNACHDAFMAVINAGEKERCCVNGYFGEEHMCAKTNQCSESPTPPPANLNADTPGFLGLDKEAFFDAFALYHGGNPETWFKTLDKIWDEKFAKFAVKIDERVGLDECARVLEAMKDDLKSPGGGNDFGVRQEVTRGWKKKFALAIHRDSAKFAVRCPTVEEIEQSIKNQTKGMAERQYGSGKHHCYVCREDLATAIHNLLKGKK